MQVTHLLWPIVKAIVDAALSGVSEVDIVVILGAALNAAGLDVGVIEVACDAVDPQRADHFIRWSRDEGSTERTILAGDVFRTMLDRDRTVLRYRDHADVFAPVMEDGATDAVALLTHLAPAVTLGFFDDVMSTFATKRPGGFAEADMYLLRKIMPAFALALSARFNAGAARILLGTYLGDEAATAMLGGRIGLGAVAKIRAVVIYCDLLNFTALTERLDPNILIEHLNQFFETVTRPASQAGGQVSGHIGDAAVMFFPIADAESERPICAAAVQAALTGLNDLERLNTSRPLAAPLRARIGIDVGEVVHGNIGSSGRFSFTIIGTPVNRAARLQALAKDFGAALLMTSDLAETAGVQCQPFGKHTLRGLEQPVEIVGLSMPA
jgi:class 3 adenylate cyclase